MDSSQSDLQLQGQHLIQRCVIVQRDERGYGLTVTGDNPVYVQSVKDDGAAKRAGVQVGDRIIKVNGTVVTYSNHVEVVKLIKSGSYVALTLLGRPPATSLSTETNSSASNQIIPRDQVPPSSPPSTRDHCRDDKTQSVERVLIQEQAFYEQTREEYMKNPSEKLQKQLAESTTRIKAFGAELAALTGKDYSMPSAGSQSAPPGQTQNPIFRSASMSDSEWIGRMKSDIPNENSDADKFVPPFPPERKYKTDQIKSKLIDNKSASKSTKSRTLPGRLRKKPATLCTEPPPSHHVRQHSSPEASFRAEGEENSGTSRKKSRGKKYSVEELSSAGAAGLHPPSSPSFLKRALLNRRSPALPPSWNSELSDKRTRNGSSPTPSTGDVEPVEKKERSDTVLSNEDEPVFTSSSDPTVPKSEGSRQMQIFCPDEEEFLSDEEIGEDHGPFNELELLKNKPAHLAVFLHYLISNSDPSSLFFWLVTDSHREGNFKEMRKWSYEIYSTFLADKAPLKVDVDKGIVQAIEATLGKECSEECLRNLFIPARSACTTEINEQLADFRSKRALGLGSLFGDNQLEDENMDRSKEMRVVEQTLMHHLENSWVEMDSTDPKTGAADYDRHSAMASALTTFMKQVGVTVKTGSVYGNILEKCSSFTQKEGKSLFKIKQSKRAKNHHLVSTHYTNVTYCNKCFGLLWGIGDQGYQCTVCEYNVHKACYEAIEETCPGPKKRKKANGGTSMKRTVIAKRQPTNAEEFATNRHVTNVHLVPSYNQPSGKGKDFDSDLQESGMIDSSADESSVARKGDRLYPTRPEEGGESFSEGEDRSVSSPEESLPTVPVSTVKKSNNELFSSRKFVMRSESVKTPKEIASKKTLGSVPRSGRKSVAIGDFRGNDIQESGVLNYGRGNDSPTLALDAVSEDAKRVRSRSATFPYTEEEVDSDFEADTQPPWQQTVDKKILKKLKQKEIKRQEVIHELIHTEKTHVRNLKVLDKVFYRPMKKKNIWQYDMIRLLFPNLGDLIQVHVLLLQAMKKRELENEVISNIGDIMLDRFDNEAGERAKEACATFCNNQKYALDQLKQRKAKDQKLAQFITACEMNPLCRRLKLNEIISTSYQRLTKYPLLLEAINKNTPSSLPDSKDIERAITCTKDLLAYVNQSVKECENHQRLLEFQKKIDKRQIESNPARNMDEVKGDDDTILLMDGDDDNGFDVGGDLHVLLLEDMVILLQKQDDRLILKCHSTNISNAYQEKTTHSPILKLNNLLTRNVATDKRAFFLVGTSAAGPLIYELVAATITERKNWYKHLTETAEAIKVKERGRRGGVSVGGGPRSNGTETQPLRRRGGLLPPGININPPPFAIQENGKSNEEEEDEKETNESSPVEETPSKEIKPVSSIAEAEEGPEPVHEPDVEPDVEPETETETETETGEDLESESEALPPPPPPLEQIPDIHEQEDITRPETQIRNDIPPPPPISVNVPLPPSLYDKTFVADLTNEESVDEKSPTQTSVISAFSESGSSSSSSNETMKSTKSYGQCSDHDDTGSSASNRSSLVLLAEQLRGKDEELKRTLQDKERIIAELRGAVMTSGYSSNEGHINSDPMEARDLILAAILQANRLTVAVSDILSPGPGEEDVSRSFTNSSLDRSDNEGTISPQQQLVLSTSILNEQLTALLGIITDRDMARESLQSELQGANSQIQRLKQGRSSSRRTRDSGSSSYISRDDDDDDVYHGFRSADLRRPSSPTSSAADIDSDYAPLSEASASDWLSEDNMDVGRSSSFSYRDRNSLTTSGYRSSTASSQTSRHRYPASKTLYWSDDPDTESQF
ncbi:uncharacterized protein LOC116302491 [Actinia tenebrosa]|uniref:Uncharacterized protein LOC116302491 n=1 Tax=Actinia tenebrosa TaxID=6105 RepID=A0A6P8ILJ9_ACTTE|nr:uncharacterized protein LOC116302491 [Actinia tenebrosa]